MYLKSLTLRGFKSFASTTTLVFEPGITCVVGPNGSGKSNVVDALAWVMGEQGAKSLRGGKMEDVIFAGTSGRAPLGRAEVVLTIDNTDGALPIDYTEVTISRTMFRTGGSEYAINGNAARLLDVQELLSDSGIGREMHVIVGQGQLDSILQATPEVRRGFIEEAAGVLKHRKRKEKAERKLDATAANLNRLSDLLGEIRRQLKPLGRQAEVARKAASSRPSSATPRPACWPTTTCVATQALESERSGSRGRAARPAPAPGGGADRRPARPSSLPRRLPADSLPRLTAAQETWYSLAGLAERVASTACHRRRAACATPASARTIVRAATPRRSSARPRTSAEAEAELQAEVSARTTALAAATEARSAAELAHAEAEKQYSAQQRAIADRREGLARLTGEVNTLRSRTEAAAAEIERLTAAQSWRPRSGR